MTNHGIGELNEFGFDQRQIDLTRANMAALQGYLDAEDVFEIRINQYGEVVCDTVKGRRIEKDPNITEAFVSGVCDHILHLNNLPRRPINYVVLPDGARGTFVFPPATIPGNVLVTIRKHMKIEKTVRQHEAEGRYKRMQYRTFKDAFELQPWEQELIDLLKAGETATFMEKAVPRRLNIAVAGPTGSGKTVQTRSFLGLVPKTERVILLEDTHEVTNHHLDEVGYLLYGDGSDDGRMTASQCLKACMRLTPDRIFLTELRDDAAWEYLTSANTGHPGGIFSTHADSAFETYGRIADLVKASRAGAGLDYNMILRRVMTSVDVVVYMEKRDVLEILYDPLAKKELLRAA